MTAPASTRRGTARGLPSTAAVLGVLVSWFAFQWDIATHVDLGRDRFFSLPHLLIIAGLWLSSGAALCSLILNRSPLRRTWTDQPGMALVLGSGVIGLADLLFDNWWHVAFSQDGTVWSPPHLLLGLVAVVGIVGALLDRRRVGLGDAWVVGAGAVLLTSLSVMLSEYEYGYPHFRTLWWFPVLALVSGFSLALARSAARLRWTATALVVVMLGLRLAASLANGVLDRSAPVLPIALLAVAVAADLLRVGTVHPRRRRVAAAALAWMAAYPIVVLWYQAFGRVELAASGWVAAGVLSTLTWLGGVTLGAFVGRRLRATVPGRATVALEPRGRTVRALGVSLLVSIPVLATALPQLGDIGRDVAADLRFEQGRMVLTVASAGPGDVVTVVGPRQRGCDPEECAESKGRQYLGRLEQVTPGRFEGGVDQPGDWFVVWYVGGDHPWATVVDRSEVGALVLEPVTPSSDASPVAVLASGLGVFSIVAVAVSSVERRLRPHGSDLTGSASAVGVQLLASTTSDEKRGLP